MGIIRNLSDKLKKFNMSGSLRRSKLGVGVADWGVSLGLIELRILS